MSASRLGVGVIGCGHICATYLANAPLFRWMEMRACADLRPEAAQAQAERFDLRAETVEGLFEADDIDILVNLTVPAAHFEVSRRALLAGKHVYSEKPFVLSTGDGKALLDLAQSRGLRIGSAPDTFFGGTHQLARKLIDDGAVGRIASGTCFFQSPGMEMWHPNPDFFFRPGGGPILDMGPYYIANLVQLLGPVERVAATSSMAKSERLITSAPRHGEKITVETPTTVQALLHFESGAQVTFCASWDVWQHGHSNMELYGEHGTLHVPDPNFFGGELRMTEHGSFVNAPGWDHPFGRSNRDDGQANYRAAGLADMAQAIIEDKPHRCSAAFSLHVVDALTSIMQSAEESRFIDIETRCDRPEPLGPEDARALLA
ncbi:MAG: Gfo/Idh/MocA family oxidoreductase [Geminicoccaceae bacterium]